MDPLTPALTVLSAMITPVVVISACATLIMSTSNRSDRATNILYEWIAEFMELAEAAQPTTGTRERQAMIFEQLDQLTSRARLLQRSLAAAYVALGLFVATSVTIAVAAMAAVMAWEWQRFALVPIGFGLLGAASLLYSALLLVVEARRALASKHGEMDFLWKQGQRYAPAEILARQQARQRAGRRWIGLGPRRAPAEDYTYPEANPASPTR